MKKWILISSVLLLSFSLIAANYLGFFAQSFSSVVEKPIERINLFDLAGKSHSFEELKGGETIIYFFASWCNPCFKTLSNLQQLSETNTLAIRLLAVALDEDSDSISKMLAKTNYQGEVWLAEEGTMTLQKRLFGNEKRAVPYIIKLDEHINIKESTYKLNSKSEWKSVLVNRKSLSRAIGI